MSQDTRILLLLTFAFFAGSWSIFDSWKTQRLFVSYVVTISGKKQPFLFCILLLAQIAGVLYAGWFVLSWLFKRHLPF